MEASIQEPIHTERLILRRLETSDSAAVFAFMSRPSVMQYTSRGPLTEHHQAQTFLSERISGPYIYNFAVTLKAPDNSSQPPVVIGILGSAGFPEVGYIFAPQYSRKGYATEALQAFTPHLFAAMPAHQLFAEAHVDPENVASIALLERCGWTRSGVQVQDAYVSPVLGLRDSVCYRIARDGYKLEDVLLFDEEEDPFVPDLQ